MIMHICILNVEKHGGGVDIVRETSALLLSAGVNSAFSCLTFAYFFICMTPVILLHSVDLSLWRSNFKLTTTVSRRNSQCQEDFVYFV